jgi:ornithine carbamoyltransferase
MGGAAAAAPPIARPRHVDRNGAATMHTNQLLVRVAEPGLKGRSFLALHDYTPDQLGALLDLATMLKEEGRLRPTPVLAGRTLAMIFQKTSTRTRVSFEVGMYQLGGHALFLSSADIQLKLGETIKDTANVLSRYASAIMIRTFAQQDVVDLAEYGQVPVINGLTDDYHPCQVMADLLTVREHLGALAGRHLVYIGDGDNNMANTLMEGGAMMGMKVTVCGPAGHQPRADMVERARAVAVDGAEIAVSDDPRTAVAGADVIYTDTFTSMGQEAEHDARLAALKDFQVNMELVRAAGRQARIMHCLPAHWGEEITEEALYCDQSIAFDQAENRLHAQKAIMAALIP